MVYDDDDNGPAPLEYKNIYKNWNKKKKTM